MALPSSYQISGASKMDTYRKYFDEAMTFLHTHQWIYNFQNTDVLVENVFDKFPIGWRYHLEKLSCQQLNEIPFGFIQDSWPESLKAFIRTCQRLKPQNELVVTENPGISVLPKDFTRGLNPKKQHEIINLSKYIHEKCTRHNIQTIIDVGAGLGYLSHLLHDIYGYKILALEAEQVRFNSALKRQEKYHKNSKESVRFVQHFVTENSAVQIDEFLQNWLGQNQDAYRENTCLIGLHACADLSVTALRIFFDLDYLKLIVLIPCCYHKLEMNNEPFSSEIGERFFKFPASQCLRDHSYSDFEAWNFLRRPFLRIACQSSASVWRKMNPQEHYEHSVCHMRRAVLQLFLIRENYILAKLKRKCTSRSASSNCDFRSYLQQLDCGFYLIPNQSVDGSSCVASGSIVKDYGGIAGAATAKFTSPQIEEKLVSLWDRFESECNALEILTCLQNGVQSVCENLILLDRVVFLHEANVEAIVEKVLEDDKSPRCHALVAFK